MRAVVSLVVVLIATLLSTGTAHADLAAAATPSIPGTLALGDAGVPVVLLLQNDSTPPTTTVTVCNFGDPLPCPVGDPGITFIASCGLLGAFSVCTAAGA